MPSYFKGWKSGLPELRKQLKKVDALGQFSLADKKTLKQRMVGRGLAPDRPDTLPMMGRSKPLLAVFDLNDLTIQALIRAD
jgi:hypothetical protein